MRKSVLTRSYYRPALGGHAPGDLRDAFVEAIETYEQWNGGSEPTVEVRAWHADGRAMPISEICGLLWNRSDALPNVLVTQLETLRGWDEEVPVGTYAAAARRLRAMIRARV